MTLNKNNKMRNGKNEAKSNRLSRPCEIAICIIYVCKNDSKSRVYRRSGYDKKFLVKKAPHNKPMQMNTNAL